MLLCIINTGIGQSKSNLKVIRNYYDARRTRLQEIYTVNSIGQRHGLYNFYNYFSVTTSPEFIVEYKNDMLDGQKTRYFTFAHTSLSGIVKETCEYKADKKNGKEIFYDYVYNGRFLTAGMDEEKEVEHIQNGKRVIREELNYVNDVAVSKKTFHANGKIRENQKADNEGYLRIKTLTNEYGEVTYEEKYDDNGGLIKKFELFPNGKLKEVKERDSIGLYNYKKYYETGGLEIERSTDKANKILSEINYDENGKMLSKIAGSKKVIFYDDGTPKEVTIENTNGDIRKEEFFNNGSTEKIITTNAKGIVIQKVIYKDPSKLNFDFIIKNDSSFYNEYDDDNKVKLTEIEDKEKNGLRITRTADGGYVHSNYKKNARGTVILTTKQIDAGGKLLSEESYKYYADANDITKKVYNNLGGYIETTIREGFNMLGESNKLLISSKEVDSAGAYFILKFDSNKSIIAKTVFGANGKMLSDSTSSYLIQYDSLENIVFEFRKYTDKWNQVWYDERKYEADGYIRNRQFYKTATYYNAAGTAVSEEKYPRVSILKFSKSMNKYITVGTLIFDDKGNKKRFFIFDQAGNEIKSIKLKNSDEKEYFNLLPTVN
jgi:antitoxin component YwqK of YwqJK toxin-antitoxin module